ncbi:MAG: phosphotransferase family protein [Halobacteriales archaeon]
MTADVTVPRADLARMVRAVEPTWELTAATAAERGFTAVHRATVDADDGRRQVVLKATPDGEPHGIPTEARLLTLLGRRTSIPVPGVLGAVDEHDELTAPFFVMDAVAGTARQYPETRHLPDAVLRRVARQTGGDLGELHAIDAVDAFGPVRYDREMALDGGRPTPTVDRVGVDEPHADWAASLRAMADRELDGLESGRFADLGTVVRETIEDHIESLAGPFDPVLGRIDHGVHNLLVAPETGDIEAVIDWGFTLAVTRGYDLATVEWVLSGAVLAGLPDPDDRRALVVDALTAGYRETADYPADELADAGSLYALLAAVRAMNHLEAGLAKIPAGTDESVAAWLRAEVGRHLE